MQRWMTVVVVGALVTLTTPTMQASDDDDEARIEYRDGWAWLIHGDRPPATDGGQEYVCSSVDSDTYMPSLSAYCNTGTHVRDGWFLAMGIQTNDLTVTGMLEHVLSHAAGEVRFQCTFEEGQLRGCRVVNLEYPPFGATFCHEMWGHLREPAGNHVPNDEPCETTGQVGPLVFTANAPPGGRMQPIGDWKMTFQT